MKKAEKKVIGEWSTPFGLEQRGPIYEDGSHGPPYKPGEAEKARIKRRFK